MTQAAFSRRVDELMARGKTRDEAISQTAWEEVHGTSEMDIPLVVSGAVA